MGIPTSIAAKSDSTNKHNFIFSDFSVSAGSTGGPPCPSIESGICASYIDWTKMCYYEKDLA